MRPIRTTHAAILALVVVLEGAAVEALPYAPATGTGTAVTAVAGGPDEPQSCIDAAKKLCGHCHPSKKCWASCAADHESELEAAGCIAPSAGRLAAIGSDWSPSDEPQSCIDKAKKLCGHCGLKKNLCWVRCAKQLEAELQAAGCTAPSAEEENTTFSLTVATAAPTPGTANFSVRVSNRTGDVLPPQCANVAERKPCAEGRARRHTCEQKGCCYDAKVKWWSKSPRCFHPVEDPCNDFKCVHGTCHVDGQRAVCDCAAGWTGTHCTTPLDPCNGFECEHGACRVDGQRAVCDCAAGWTGTHCKTSFGQLPGCLGEFASKPMWKTRSGERGIHVTNELQHEVFLEMASCVPSGKHTDTCKGAFRNRLGALKRPTGGDVPVSICRVPVDESLFIPVPTDFEIDSFKMFPKWGCNEAGQNCSSHQELPPCGASGNVKCAAPISTALEATFNSPGGNGMEVVVDGLRGWNESIQLAPGWKTDFVDMTAVDGLTVDFAFRTLGDAYCTNGATCTSDDDCGESSVCVQACTDPPCYCDSTADPGQKCPGMDDKTCAEVADCSDNAKACQCPSAGACRGALGPLTANVALTECPSDITLSGDDFTFEHVDLRVHGNLADRSQVTGCASPCSYLTKSFPDAPPFPVLPLKVDGSSDIAGRYCCKGKYSDSEKCREASPGNNHAFMHPDKPNEYVVWIHQSAQGIYAWQYDEKTGHALWACDWGRGSADALLKSAPSYEWKIRRADAATHILSEVLDH